MAIARSFLQHAAHSKHSVTMTRVLLYSVEPMLLERLSTASFEVGGFGIVACSCRAQLPSDLTAHRPDIILLDGTAELATDLLSMLQHLTPLPRIVLRVRSAPPEFALRTVALGVRGVILKSASIATLLCCLNSVSEGELWFDKSLFDVATLPLREPVRL